MVRVAISQEAFEAIVTTLPVGTVAYEAEADAKGERLIWLERRYVDRGRDARAGRELFGCHLEAGGDGPMSRKASSVPARWHRKADGAKGRRHAQARLSSMRLFLPLRRNLQREIAGKASRGVVGEITKRVRARPTPAL
jgi:hypothetical protein